MTAVPGCPWRFFGLIGAAWGGVVATSVSDCGPVTSTSPSGDPTAPEISRDSMGPSSGVGSNADPRLILKSKG